MTNDDKCKHVTPLQNTLPPSPRRERTAAYARVSLDTADLKHSLSAQVSYYSRFIQQNPQWEYAGVYADCGISGTSSSRPQWQQLLSDCRAGKIDIILTKSISRFARNTVDLLTSIRQLKALGVAVRFEKEQLDSATDDGELMLTILASFAQEESRSISDNVKWRIRRKFEQGIPAGRFRVLGYHWEGNQMVIIPEEAAIVRYIFQNFLKGKSPTETKKELDVADLRTAGGYPFCDSSIRGVLRNITYTGNTLLQKTFIADPIHKIRRYNRGELPQFFVKKYSRSHHFHGDFPGSPGQNAAARGHGKPLLFQRACAVRQLRQYV